MRLKSSVAIGAVALTAALIMPGMASAHGTHVKAKMSGSKVVGQSGAPNGSGTANLHLLRNKGQIKFKVKFADIGGEAGLNIAVYKGKTGQNGAEQVALVSGSTPSPARGKAKGVSAQTLRQMTRSPHKFHVTVKNNTYPTDGAIRGQLKANPNV